MWFAVEIQQFSVEIYVEIVWNSVEIHAFGRLLLLKAEESPWGSSLSMPDDAKTAPPFLRLF